tara:strand:- start:8768 stop:9169 length:402 start_codon:yes stop_codon:yes gene_type:complete
MPRSYSGTTHLDIPESSTLSSTFGPIALIHLIKDGCFTTGAGSSAAFFNLSRLFARMKLGDAVKFSTASKNSCSSGIIGATLARGASSTAVCLEDPHPIFSHLSLRAREPFTPRASRQPFARRATRFDRPSVV